MDRGRAVASFALATLLFGTAFPAVKAGLEYVPPLLLGTARYACSAAVLLAVVAARRGYWRPRTGADYRAVLAGGVFLIGGTGLGFLGQQYVASGVAAIVVSLSPVLTALFGWVLLPAERLSRRGFLGVGVGLLGVAVVVRPDPANLLGDAVVGRLLLLGAAVAVTLGTVLVRRSDPPMPVPALTGWAMAVGTVVLATGSVLAGESVAAVEATPAAVGVVAYLGVAVGAVGFVLYFQLVESVGPLRANLTTYVVPVVALAVGAVALGERVEPAALAGFLIIVAGFALLESEAVVETYGRYRGAVR